MMIDNLAGQIWAAVPRAAGSSLRLGWGQVAAVDASVPGVPAVVTIGTGADALRMPATEALTSVAAGDHAVYLTDGRQAIAVGLLWVG